MSDDFEQIIRHFAKSPAMSDGPMAFHEHCMCHHGENDIVIIGSSIANECSVQTKACIVQVFT